MSVPLTLPSPHGGEGNNNLSVLILTRNEEADLPGCLASVNWSDDVHVFDSFSIDRTVEIARQAGARVTQRVFDNYAAQRNAALHGLKFKYPWLLSLDADERVPEALRDELKTFVAAAPADAAAVRIRRRDFFMGTWLKHAQLSPWFIRLVRPEKVRYEREVNEVLLADGRILDLRQPFDHFPFSKGLAHWFERHNRYSTMEAEQIVKARRGGGAAGIKKFSIRKAMFAADFNERRWHQKELFYRLPFRPWIKWCYMMFLRGAILDGRAGIAYARLQAIYEQMIVLKTREAEAAAAADSPQSAQRTQRTAKMDEVGGKQEI